MVFCLGHKRNQKMKRTFKGFLVAMIVFLVVPSTVQATNYTYSPISYPDSTATVPMDINDNGCIVGSYSPERGIERAFMYVGSTYQAIEIEGASFSRARSVDKKGKVVGEYRGEDGQIHGFIYEDGTISTYDIEISGATRTMLTGINDNGVLVGTYDDGSGNLIGFQDDHGIITLTGGLWHNAVNNFGQIVGVYRPGSSSNRGYLYKDGNISTVPVENLQSQAWDINNTGIIVGDFYSDGSLGFMLDGDEIIEFDYPGVDSGTYLTGINDLGTVVGVYQDTSLGYARSQGFVAVVPLPPTFLLFGSGLLRLGLLVWRRKRD
jgi:probable HAF family extracellular repeat protein